jgi:hypothetical protein
MMQEPFRMTLGNLGAAPLTKTLVPMVQPMGGFGGVDIQQIMSLLERALPMVKEYQTIIRELGGMKGNKPAVDADSDFSPTPQIQASIRPIDIDPSKVYANILGLLSKLPPEQTAHQSSELMKANRDMVMTQISIQVGRMKRGDYAAD